MSSVGAEINVVGQVQGVGFRFFCHRLASSLKITGWVKNNYDGSVLVRAEGDRSQIEELINNLKVGPRAAVVKDIKIRWLPFSGEFKDFEITG
ncbi:MAG: acylphosphatase [Candidatus Zixiibacteriota bacterium]